MAIEMAFTVVASPVVASPAMASPVMRGHVVTSPATLQGQDSCR